MPRAFIIFMFSMSFAVGVSAKDIVVCPQPPSVFADTEVSTNVPFRVDFGRLDKVRFVLELSPSVSNDVEVLVGHDADTNGVLSVEESAYAFGCDCGQWFVREGEELRTDEGAADLPRTRHELSVRRKDIVPDWNLVKVIRRGASAADESVSVAVENRRFVISVR